MVHEPLAPAELKAVVGCCNLFVAIRQVNLIPALSQAVPTLALSHDPQIGELMERLRVPYFVLAPCRQARSTIVELARRLWEERREIGETLRKALHDEVLPAARHNIRLLAEHIDAPEEPLRPGLPEPGNEAAEFIGRTAA